MYFNVGDTVIIKCENTIYGGLAVTITEINPKTCTYNGEINNTKTILRGFDDTNLIITPYDQTNFKFNWIKLGDEAIGVCGTRCVITDINWVKENFDPNTFEYLRDTETYDYDLYSITREGVTIFQRKEIP